MKSVLCSRCFSPVSSFSSFQLDSGHVGTHDTKSKSQRSVRWLSGLRVSATKSDDPSSILGINMVGGENQLCKLFIDFHR